MQKLHAAVAEAAVGASVFAMLSMTLGCAGRGEEAGLRELTGKVSYQGRPVTYGRVTLYPLSGPPNPPAVINPDGSFSARAADGEYKVVVEAIPPPEGAKPDPLAEGGYDYSHAKPAKSLVPIKYSRPETSDVTVKVTADNQSNLTIALR